MFSLCVIVSGRLNCKRSEDWNKITEKLTEKGLTIHVTYHTCRPTLVYSRCNLKADMKNIIAFL